MYSSIAWLLLDEQGNEESVTFAEMFEEVKLYAAAFRKNGLKKGDTVACKFPICSVYSKIYKNQNSKSWSIFYTFEICTHTLLYVLF